MLKIDYIPPSPRTTCSVKNDSELSSASGPKSFAHAASHFTLNPNIPYQQIMLDLIDTPEYQRQKHVNALSGLSQVYMTAEHSRFPHTFSTGTAAIEILDKFSFYSPNLADEIQAATPEIAIAALSHDLGQIAPGSHLAWKCFFPNNSDEHEMFTRRIFSESESIRQIFRSEPDLHERVLAVLSETSSPSWKWQIVSGGGFNVDRQSYHALDSVMAGVSYGFHDIDPLVKQFVITPDGELGISESPGLEILNKFLTDRSALYNFVYQHKTGQIVDQMFANTFQRVRDLLSKGNSEFFLDEHMLNMLTIEEPAKIPLESITSMLEYRTNYHLDEWRQSSDSILADLSRRILDRDLFKSIKISEFEQSEDELFYEVKLLAEREGFDPQYFVGRIEGKNVMKKDLHAFPRILRSDKSVVSIGDIDAPIRATLKGSPMSESYLFMPKEVRNKLHLK